MYFVHLSYPVERGKLFHVVWRHVSHSVGVWRHVICVYEDMGHVYYVLVSIC